MAKDTKAREYNMTAELYEKMLRVSSFRGVGWLQICLTRSGDADSQQRGYSIVSK